MSTGAYITAAEAARLLGITPRAVRLRVAAGTLAGRRHKGRVLVDRSALDAEIASDTRALAALANLDAATLDEIMALASVSRSPGDDSSIARELRDLRRRVEVLERQAR